MKQGFSEYADRKFRAPKEPSPREVEEPDWEQAGYEFETGRRQAMSDYYQEKADEKRSRNATGRGGAPDWNDNFFKNYQDPFNTFPKKRKKQKG